VKRVTLEHRHARAPNTALISVEMALIGVNPCESADKLSPACGESNASCFPASASPPLPSGPFGLKGDWTAKAAATVKLSSSNPSSPPTVRVGLGLTVRYRAVGVGVNITVYQELS